MSAPASTKTIHPAVPSTVPTATGASMRASAGGEIVERGTAARVAARPYDMRWADDGHAAGRSAAARSAHDEPITGGGHVPAR
ncbi:DUF1918 domain-containing protein [Streptomyces sp. CG1]|uniref:DUF1918 domain-containing protein n=1 Tax=Streptomyces sp. CG1 TaxID=1287523 RepID=UPI0034E1D70C